ncbi:hypothetical protein L3X38_011742 [Prunus dulcis]|uniref:Integrase catalytic domain-containing protein n=1 Tax=Prunus dulcis TaxID=3755 RepID=A0AAD4ZFP9_PRUDU|nr:hypothetical protein L3X38_011742 [Prunus dulcis]
MRQRRWVELIKDYNCTIEYHPGRANVTVDALIWKSSESLAYLRIAYLPLLVELQKDGEELGISQQGGLLTGLHVRPILVERVIATQLEDPTLSMIRLEVENGTRIDYAVGEDRALKCEHITMEFVFKLPRTSRGHDRIWVIVDQLTKSTHFLLIKETYSLAELAKLFVDESVRLHGALISIVSDRNARF